MKTLLGIVLITSSTLSFSMNEEAKAQKFAEKKTKILANIDGRISVMNTFRSCVQSANSKEAMKSCRSAKKSAMQQYKRKKK